MASRDEPAWLRRILADSSPPPRTFAWTLDNLHRGKTPEPSLPRRTSGESDHEQRVFVLGMGNLGCLYATCLSQLADPPPITLVVHRRSLLEHWASDPGIEITRYGHLERLANFDIEWWTDEKPSFGPVREIGDGAPLSNLLVATKAPDAVPQVDRLRGYLDDSSTVVFVQNGMNRLWPPHGAVFNAHRYPGGSHPNFLHGVTMHGVFSEGVFRSVHAAPADVVIGPVCPSDTRPDRANYLTKLITTAPHLAGRAVSRSELWVLQLEKLVVNMVINPMSAVLRVRNGDLFADPHGKAIHVMDRLLDEISTVLQALVRHGSQEILQGSDVSCTTLLRRLSVPNLREMLYRIGDKVKHNRSSMLQDIQAGKQTEIKEFNGWLVETAESLGQGLHVESHMILIDLVEQGSMLDEAELERRLLPGKR